MNFGLHAKQSRFTIGFIFLFFLISPITAWAGVDDNKEEAAITAQKQKLEAETNFVFNQINTTSTSALIGRIINGAMGILGSLALAMFVYGGFLWMTAAGESAKSEKARSVVVWAALGIAVIFASYAILQMVFEAFI